MSQRPLNLADVIEAMADAIPDRAAIRTIDRNYSYAEIDERSTRLANHLVALGIKPGEHIAVHSANRIEWVDAFYGAFKARAVPININFKYRAEELAYLYDNADCVAAIVAPEYAELARKAGGDKLRHLIVLDEDYDAALAASSPERMIEGRTGDDHYVIYTGGTTGQPKGVVWRNEDLIKAALNAARYGAPIESVEKLAAEAIAVENPMVLLACGPMMHGGSQWIMGNGHVAGQTVALYTEANFDPATVLDLVQKASVVSLTFLGDAMGRPVAEAILAEPDRWDLSTLMAVSNGAAPLSSGVREEIARALPGRFILDTYGASETGAGGTNLDDGTATGPIKFGVGPDIEVFTPDLKPAAIGEEGMLGRSGTVPLGYYKDEKKSAATFQMIDGKRWSIPGDFARREEDGTIVLLGRGSVCINSGGEKIHPEEVEAVLMRHPAVFDAAVVGTASERWGQQVTALVHRREGFEVTEADLIAHTKELIASYKAPKSVFFVGEVPRTPVSKVDYRKVAEAATQLVETSSTD